MTAKTNFVVPRDLFATFTAKARTYPGKWFFLACFAFACFLFWWLPSILFRIVVHESDSITDQTLVVSFVGLATFCLGYLLPAIISGGQGTNCRILDACEQFAHRAMLVVFLPAFVVALYVLHRNLAYTYGLAGPIPPAAQVVLYIHLFLGFLYIGAADPQRRGWRPLVVGIALTCLPRLVVSMHGSRFFLAQAVVPIVLIAISRRWIRLTAKRIFQFAILGLLIVFGPAITRGDPVIGQEEVIKFFAAGSSLNLYQNNTDLSLTGLCPPLLVSLTAKTVPYGSLGVCVTDMGGLHNLPLTLDRILTLNDPSSFQGTASGTGSNFLLDLYLFGGPIALVVGTVVFGFTCANFMRWIGHRSLYAGIWGECLSRALMAPRGNLGYVYERIPTLILATWVVVAILWAGRLVLSHNPAGSINSSCDRPEWSRS